MFVQMDCYFSYSYTMKPFFVLQRQTQEREVKSLHQPITMEQSTAAEGKTHKRHKKKREKKICESVSGHTDESDQDRDSSPKGAKSAQEKKTGKKRRSLSCGGLTDLSGDFSQSIGELVTATSHITAPSKKKHFSASDGGDFQDVAPSPQKKKKQKGEAKSQVNASQEESSWRVLESPGSSQEGVQRREKKKKRKGEAKSQVNMSEEDSRWTVLEGSSAMDSQSREGVQRLERKKKRKGEADVDSQEEVQRREKKKKQKHSTRERYAPHTSGVDGEEALPDDVNEGGSDSGVGQFSETIVGGFDQHSRGTQRESWQADSPKKKKKKKPRGRPGSPTTDMDSVGAQGSTYSDPAMFVGSVDDSADDRIEENKRTMSPRKKTKKKKKTGKERSDSESQVTEMDSSYAEESFGKVEKVSYQTTGSARTSYHQYDYQGSRCGENSPSAQAEMSQSLGSEGEEAVSNAESSHEADRRPQGAAAGDRKKCPKSKKVSSSKTKQAEKKQSASILQSPVKIKSVEFIENESDDSSSSRDEGERPNCNTAESHENGASQSSGASNHRWDSAKCYLCKEAVSGKEAYIAHLAQEHRKLSYRCRKCNKALSSEEHLMSHMKIVCQFKGCEDMLAPFHCHLCPLSYSRKSCVQKHLQTEHGTGKPVDAKCRHCGQEFTTAFRAKVHMLKCAEGMCKVPKHGDYECYQCGLLYSSSQSRSYHVRTDHLKHVFVCLCGKKFRGSSYYYYHRKECAEARI